MCRAVGHAHRRGVVHGRLAPSAIDVGEAGEIRVGRWDDAVVTDGDASAPSAADHDVAAAAAHAAASAPSAADHDVAAAAHAAAAAPDVAAPHAAAAAHDVAALHALLATVLAAERDSAPELAELLAPDAAAPDATALARRVTDYLDGERDQALRADLARELTAAARAALADAGPDRERALALARRALALDPSLDDAAGIVARLLVELPDPLPPAAQAAIVASDQRVLRRLGTGFIGAFGAFFAYVPLMVLQGVRDPTMVIAIAVASGLMLAWAIQWRVRGPHVFTWPPMVGAALVLTLYARTYGPFVNAPPRPRSRPWLPCSSPSGRAPRW
ncbi:MAG: hypothetical protein IPL61_00830 [Myxococcales bacterium]|nr:hypothetical protein [Myxococcales bacterium]